MFVARRSFSITFRSFFFFTFGFTFVSLLSLSWFLCNSRAKNGANLILVFPDRNICDAGIVLWFS